MMINSPIVEHVHAKHSEQSAHNDHLPTRKQLDSINNSDESSDSHFVPNFRNKQKIIVKPLKLSKSKKIGSWTLSENNKYISFLKRYNKEISDPILRKKKKIFNKMSMIIKSRSADQCRGHHLKFKKRYGSVDAIIINISRLVEENSIATKLMIKQKAKAKHDIANKNTAASYDEQPKQELKSIRIILQISSIPGWHRVQNNKL